MTVDTTSALGDEKGAMTQFVKGTWMEAGRPHERSPVTKGPPYTFLL